jgi:hypothetical protein
MGALGGNGKASAATLSEARLFSCNLEDTR